MILSCGLNGTCAGIFVVSALRFKQASRELKRKSYIPVKFPLFGAHDDKFEPVDHEC